MRTLISMLILTVLTTTAWADLDSLRSEAQIAATAGEVDIATSKLQQILKLAPDDGASHYQLAVLLMDNNGDAFDSIQHFEHARDLEFQPLGVAYRLSRLYARAGRDNDALEQLEILADGGFGSLTLVENQIDYDNVSSNPRFAIALEAIRAARFPCAADERHAAFDFWIGDSGSIIEFTGEARDGGVFFTAETVNPVDGNVTHHKFEFTVMGEDGVRQYWETSTDDGNTWRSIWDARYERKMP